MPTLTSLLQSTYQNAREALANIKKLNNRAGWKNIERTMIQTAWDARRQLREERPAA